MAWETSNNNRVLNPEDFYSEEFLMIAFSVLEMKGYTGFLQLFSVLEKPQEVIKVIRLMSGMQFKVPSLTEFSEAITLCIFFFLYATSDKSTSDALKNIWPEFMDNPEKKSQYIKQFDIWCEYLKQNGYQVSDFIKFRSHDNPLYKKLKRNGW